MTVTPKLHIEGPLESSGSSGNTNDLHLVQEATNSSETDSRQQSIVGQDDKNAILAGITGKRDVSYSGLANGYRLMQAGLGNDPVEALINGLYELESLVVAEQGQGYRVTDDVRSKTYQPEEGAVGILFDTIRWNYEAGEGLDVEWNLDGKLTEGVQNVASRSDYVDEQKRKRSFYEDQRAEPETDRVTTDNLSINLGDVEKRSYERSVNLNATDLVHQYDFGTVGVIESGVEGEVRFEGLVSYHHVDDVKQVARQLNGPLQGVQVNLQDSFTRRDFPGLITDVSTTFKAGRPDRFEYQLTLTVGSQPFQSSA